MSIRYTLIRARRRTVAIYIKNGAVEVRAPMKMPKRDIDSFVASKSGWITKHLTQTRENAKRRADWNKQRGEDKDRLIADYKRKANDIIPARVQYFAGIMSVTPTAVKINAAKTRWGSCSAKRSLNFSWRIAMAEDSEIDYVVVHELAHMKEMNHSARFWAIVENVLPDYNERRRRLWELQKRLNAEDWGE
jgi:predicted metal-dependent hydrolase